MTKAGIVLVLALAPLTAIAAPAPHAQTGSRLGAQTAVPPAFAPQPSVQWKFADKCVGVRDFLTSSDRFLVTCILDNGQQQTYFGPNGPSDSLARLGMETAVTTLMLLKAQNPQGSYSLSVRGLDPKAHVIGELVLSGP